MLPELLSTIASTTTTVLHAMTNMHLEWSTSRSLFEMMEGIPASQYQSAIYSQRNNVYGVLIAVLLILLYNDMRDDDDDFGNQG